MQKIFILGGEVQTGKSAALWHWSKHNHCKGFITPTIAGVKYFIDVWTKQIHLYEQLDAKHESIAIGKYLLSENAFQVARDIASEAAKKPASCFVIDEIGKLELKNEGHHELMKTKLPHIASDVLLVVRTHLIDAVVQQYDLKNVQVLDIKALETCQFR